MIWFLVALCVGLVVDAIIILYVYRLPSASPDGSAHQPLRNSFKIARREWRESRSARHLRREMRSIDAELRRIANEWEANRG